MSALIDSQPEYNLAARLEALLFVAAGPVTLSQLATALEVPPADVESALMDLQAYYSRRCLRIQQHAGGMQLTTAPEVAGLVERFLGLETTARLSRAALETLAIVAYRQPVTRPEIEALRGVSSDGVLKNLLSKELVQEMGRADRPGRPFLYGTTQYFLQHFGLNSLDELPPFTKPQTGEPHQEQTHGAEQQGIQQPGDQETRYANPNGSQAR